MLKKISSNQAVSEVVGVVLLLAITVALFATIQPYIFSFSFGSSVPLSNLIGSIDKTNNMIYIEHDGGESLEGTTDIMITIGSTTYTKKTSELLIDINHDNKWNFGESIRFDYTGIDIIDQYVGVTVVDSSAVLLSVVLQKGSS